MVDPGVSVPDGEDKERCTYSIEYMSIFPDYISSWVLIFLRETLPCTLNQVPADVADLLNQVPDADHSADLSL